MRRWHVVLGANYGDEGKGLVTDWLCHNTGVDLCVRFNGGAQAGHTVVTPSGARHVFGHLGAGAFAGADTLLGPRFIVNPLLYFKERAKLAALGATLTTWVSQDCPVTTPYEMALNQLAAKKRGSLNTCGVGINETMQRHWVGPFTFGDLASPAKVQSFIEWVHSMWVPERAYTLGVDALEVQGLALKKLDDFREQCALMAAVCSPLDHNGFHFLTTGDVEVVFEGAQGLLLDSESKNFPYVTNSRTGLDNVLELAEREPPEEMDVYFVTRSYVTRHGEGPFEDEWARSETPAWEDKTNVTNDWQGPLRYGSLNEDELATRILFELRKVPPSVKVNPKIVITHVDQLEPPTRVRARNLKAVLGEVEIFLSYGPTRDDVRELS